jgi:hypothetical protein
MDVEEMRLFKQHYNKNRLSKYQGHGAARKNR